MKTQKPLDIHFLESLFIYFFEFFAYGVTVVVLLLIPINIICGTSNMYLFRLLFRGYFLLWIVLSIHTGWVIVFTGGE